jgi:hypothetical protein
VTHPAIPDITLTPAQASKALCDTMVKLGASCMFKGTGLTCTIHQITYGDVTVNMLLPLHVDITASDLKERIEQVVEAILQ